METVYIDEATVIGSEATATIGFFDGVHKGHAFLIDQLKQQAGQSGMPTAIISFREHPRKVLDRSCLQPLLSSFEEKTEALQEAGIDYFYVLDFSKELSNLSGEEFMKNILRRQLNIKQLLIGYDHRFGKDRSDGFDDYVAFGQDCGMEVLPAEEYRGDDRHISSTAIRKELSAGNVQSAASMLGRPYCISGKVVAGNKIGREIGFPTANLQPTEKDKLIPGTGVYAVTARLNDRIYKGMAYIGNRPTLPGENERRIEVNIFDFNGSLYDQTIRVCFVERLRGDQKFGSMDELSRQLEKDKQNAIHLLSER